MRHFCAVVAAGLLFPVIAAAQQDPAPPAPATGKIAFSITPERLPEAGQTIRVTSQLTRDGKPLEADAIRSQTFHLFLVDPSFTDYQNIIPKPTATPGSYLFTFTPKFSAGYYAWVDVTPMGGEQQFIPANLGEPKAQISDKTVSTRAEISGYRVEMSLNSTVRTGYAAQAVFNVTDKDGNVTRLEPVMGAFAHLVGFYDDGNTFLATQNILTREAPASTLARGPSELIFQFTPPRTGFVKLFLQLKIDGQEIVAPFGVTVLP